MGIRSTLINNTLGLLFRLFVTIDDRDLKKLPARGPAILISNHTSNIEGPLFYVRLRPRPTIAMAKAELWKFFATRQIMEAWRAIPVRRGRLDRNALGQCARVLERGEFLCIAPEGKRSKDGTLLRGQPGAVWFALDREVPIYPMVQWGCRNILSDLLHLRRPKVTIKVGRPFVVRTPAGAKAHGEVLEHMADEMMIQMARQLPEKFHGVYAGQTDQTPVYLQFTGPA